MPAPPFTLTPLILSQLAEICGQVGQLEGGDGVDWGSRSPQLRKDKRIRSIHSSPAMDQNLVTMTQPESPNSPTQKYHLTDEGKTLLKMMEKTEPR